MTEVEWLAGQSKAMVTYARSVATMRQRRLLACGYCRLHWDALPDDRLKRFVVHIEKYADGAGSSLVRAYTLYDVVKVPAVRNALPPGLLPVLKSAQASNGDSIDNSFPLWSDAPAQVALLRDIFGNPFHPTPFSPEWRTATAVALASQMYESRDFGAMPILADALQDAGCDNTDVLNHCREPGVHVRGCWVVDLVLDKG
ncbi:Uncharacterized protein (Fragment) OS=uncultured bacterium PE=4 SV=1 [Gemmata massiliana]|uniref:SMI1/KNR4 family protein n=1 Tax=Gemmata massiliana TaxID=1210884 RepID=A0A6P2D048_9BACT